MDKIAAYEVLLEDHPLWIKEAEKKVDTRSALLGGAAVGGGLLAGAAMARRRAAPGLAAERQKLLRLSETKGRLEGRLFEKYKRQGMSSSQAQRKINRILSQA